jgi:hypothetical protein
VSWSIPSLQIWTDCKSAARRTQEEAAARGFTIVWGTRAQVRNAHVTARQIRGAWEAGRLDRPTWREN